MRDLGCQERGLKTGPGHHSGQSGFTLLELIIVIVIMGVLVSLALPRFSRLIEGTYAAEAVNNLSALQKSIARCHLLRGNSPADLVTECFNIDDWSKLDIENPGGHFDYSLKSFGAMGVNNWRYSIVAVRNDVDLFSNDDPGMADLNCGFGSSGGKWTHSAIGMCVDNDVVVGIAGIGFYSGIK